MSTLAEFTTPQIEIGECIEVLAGTANNGTVISTTQGDFVLASETRQGFPYNVYKQAEYPDLYARLGLLYGNSWRPIATALIETNVNNYTYSAAYGNGLYLIGTANGQIQTSNSGTQWTRVASSNTSSAINAFTYGNNLYLYSTNGGGLSTSTNGVDWTQRTSGTTSSLYDLVYGAGLYVVVGAGGLIRTSTDGIAWNVSTSGTTSLLIDIEYGNGIYVASGFGGVIRTSTNGLTWNASTSGTTSTIGTLIYGNGTFVYAIYNALGTGIASSTNAVTWTARTNPGNQNTIAYGGAYGNGLYVLMGFGGMVVTSTDGIDWSFIDAYGFRGYGSLWIAQKNIAYGNGTFVCGNGIQTGPVSNNNVFITSTPRRIIWSSGYDANTEFAVPVVTMANLSLGLTTFGLNSSPRYVTYMRAK